MSLGLSRYPARIGKLLTAEFQAVHPSGPAFQRVSVTLAECLPRAREAGHDGALARAHVDEYRVPLLPPELAASMALSIEIATPILLVLGFLTRFAVAILLAMTAVIQTFVYPEAWPTHLQWTAMMLVLLCRGAGTLSIDHLLWRRYAPNVEAKTAVRSTGLPRAAHRSLAPERPAR